MKLQLSWPFVLILFIVGALFILNVIAAPATNIENASCEQIGPSLFRIDYQSAGDTGRVEVFASSRSDRIDSDKPVLIMERPPVNVSVSEPSGRVYFHLRTENGAIRVVSVRRLPLEGAVNFRDLGGYQTTDGRHVRWGMVYRSGDLVNLTVDDYRYLDSLGIRLVCDVRTDAERKRSPTKWSGKQPEFLLAPIGQEKVISTVTEGPVQEDSSSVQQSKTAVSGYDRYVIEYAEQYGTLLRRLAAGDLPAVEHCSSGKDRTGIFSAILLTALGVPRKTVIQDYLLTSKYLLAPDTIGRTTADLQRVLGLSHPPGAAFVLEKMTLKPEVLDAAFVTINKNYGSFENYLRIGLRVSDSELAMLRQRLLEP